MNRILQYGDVNNIPHYNCSWKSDEQWLETGKPRLWLGIPILLFGIVTEVLYFPILFIIFKTKLIKLACYKIIVMLAVFDMVATLFGSIVCGLLLIEGAVFCSHPNLSYVAGCFGVSTWCAACAITASLFVNRIVSMGFREYAETVEKPVAYGTMTFCVSYWFYVWFFTSPTCFNSLIMAWPSDPLAEVPPSEEATEMYRNPVQGWNNRVFACCMFFLFTTYCTMVNRLARGQKSKAARSIFIQCSIICFFNTLTAVVYLSLSFVTPDPWILVSGQFGWSINHGCPAYIYITMNDTIRKEFRRMIFGATVDQKISSVGFSTTIHRKSTMVVTRI